MGWRWRGAGRRDEKWRDIGGAGLHLGITKRSDAVDPPRPLRDKESNRQGTDPTSPEHPHLDENNLLWENQTTPLRGAPPRRDCPVDAGSPLSIEQPGPPICCQAYSAKCLSCAEGISRNSSAGRTHKIFWVHQVARSTQHLQTTIAARHTMPNASLASRA